MMRFFVREIIKYQTPEGRVPFLLWLEGFNDDLTRFRIHSRLSRAEDGNFGDYRHIGKGIYELRMHFGPGYRIYFGLYGTCIVLLNGGDKNSQEKDIEQAKKYWREFLQRRS